MTHIHPKVSPLFRNKHDLRAHLVISHSFPRWATTTKGYTDLEVMHVDMHILESALQSKDEERAVDLDELRIGILSAWYDHPICDKLTSVELREAAALAADYMVFEAAGWNVERVHRV